MKKKLIIIASLLVLIVGALVYYFSFNKINITNEEPVKEEQPLVVENDEYKSLMENWKKNKEINDDYVGDVVFESGLINLPFVCPSKPYDTYSFYTNSGKKVTDYENGCEGGACSGNDVYLRMDWKTMKYELGGSVFMDYRNSTYDQNIIIYGHHYPKSMDADRVLFFTPLEKLMQKENYEDNKNVSIVLGDQKRNYVVAYAYIFHMNPNTHDDLETLQYYRTNYDTNYYGEPDPGYYAKYIQKMEEVKLYDTGVKLEESDNTLTLQTCLENDPSAVEIVVCKEIGKDYFN